MYCRKCGTEIKDSAKFCDNCGAEVIKVKQRSYSNKYIEHRSDKKKTDSEAKRREKYRDERNPYVSAAMLTALISLGLAVFPWGIIGKGIGTSFPMRLVAFALLGDYHSTKARQVNNLLYSKYGFRIQENTVTLFYYLSMFMTLIGLFALFVYST